MLKTLKRRLIAATQSRFPNWDITIALRYLPIVQILTSKYSPPAKILEVGPGELGILPYLPPEFTITGADIDFGAASQTRMKMHKTTDSNLPFKDSSFDVVISVDTLEHIPPAARQTSIDEMVRVSTRQIRLAFPSGQTASFCDSVLDRFFRSTHRGIPFPYLSEHLSFGLPDSGATHKMLEAALKKNGKSGKIMVHNNANFLVWLGLLFLGFSEVPALTSLYILTLWTIPVLRYLNFWPSYRKLFVVEINAK